MLTNSSLTHYPWHADEEHHTPNVQHAADLERERTGDTLLWVHEGVRDQTETKFAIPVQTAGTTHQPTMSQYHTKSSEINILRNLIKAMKNQEMWKLVQGLD